ncbi:MAG: response regulator [Desulfobacteraceae bacterium]|nr:response regulator [Desulfobacteraceae bacterium]
MNEKTLNILLLEDNPGEALSIQEMLSRTNRTFFCTETAQRLSEDIDNLSSKSFDAVLLDLGIQERPEIEDLQSVFPDTAIVVLTDKDHKELAMQYVQKGAQDYLIKEQITPDLLSMGIRCAFECKHAEKLSQENRKLETRVQQVRKMESAGVFAAGIVHDFSNILYSIIGYSEMIINDMPETKEYMEQVLKAAWRGRDTIKQIHTLGSKAGPEKKTVQISVIADEVLELVKAVTPNNIEVRLNILTDNSLVLANSSEIHQVLMNLYTNACHAMQDKNGALEITLTDEEIVSGEVQDDLHLIPGSYIKLSVADNGCGMDKEVMERIFDPFFTTKEQGKGTGLGLSMVYRIISNHGGYITVNSKPGRGSTFCICLPKSEESIAVPTAIDEKAVQGGSERILLVEDEESVWQVLKMMLEDTGYNITDCSDGPEALKMFNSHPDAFDLVITDSTIPKMTGICFAGKVMETRPDIPVILISGFIKPDTDQKARDAGIRELIMKPVNRADLGC